jgi:hypothetical protein
MQISPTESAYVVGHGFVEMQRHVNEDEFLSTTTTTTTTTTTKNVGDFLTEWLLDSQEGHCSME